MGLACTSTQKYSNSLISKVLLMANPPLWQSLRVRLLAMMVVMILGVAIIGIWLENRADMAALQRQAQDEAALVASLVHAGMDDARDLSAEFAALAKQPLLSRLLIVEQGRVVESSGPFNGQLLADLNSQVWLPAVALDTEPHSYASDSQSLFVFPFTDDGRYLLLWFDTLPSADTQFANRIRLLGLALVVVMVAGIAFYVVSQRLLNDPLNILVAVLQRRIKGERQARVPALGTHELGQLGHWLNQTMDSEDAALEALRLSNLEGEDQKARFLRIFKVMPDLVTVTELDNGTLVDVNENWVKATGWPKQEAIGKTAAQLGLWLDPADREKLLGQIRDNLLHAARIQFQSRWGDRIEAEASGCVFEEQGKRYLLLSLRDISDRLRKERDLHLLAQVVEVSLDGVMITDASQSILAVNSAFTAITGFSADDVVGHTPRVLSSGYQERQFYQRMWQQIHIQGMWQGEIWNKRKSGEIYPQWLSIRSVKDDDGQVLHYVAVFSDITDRKAAEARIAFLAYHDPLTGLPNRTWLVDKCENAISQARQQQHMLALVYLDLDRFKSVNDSLGHDIGDALLNEVVKRIKPLCMADELLSRQGGDEFLILLPNIENCRRVEMLVERILAVMSEPFSVGGHRLWVSTSIGVSVFPEDGDNAAQLLRKADTALYHAKDSGRSTFSFFARDMDKNLTERLQMEAALKEAIGTEQLQLYYQPQVLISTGQVVGVEALMRWQSPELGSVSPGRFIPLAEETGLIMPLGAWCLEEACRQLAQWRQLGFNGLMAVNISVRQILRADFFDLLEEVLAQSAIPADRLELELTESLMMDNVEASLEVVQRLKGLDVSLAIDDFGTGYSSLSYLKRFAVDCLKIDQSFIRGLREDNQQARSLIRAIVQMAHNLELNVVAEGVETLEQLAILTAEEVDVAQGYYLGKPMPASEVEVILRNQGATLRVNEKG